MAPCNVEKVLKAFMSKKTALKSLLLLALSASLSSCVVNPVTGEREVRVISDRQAIDMGQQQYGPAQQMQGGVLVADPGLQAYVQRVGDRVAVASGVDLPYEFVVLNNTTPNAWALPGGKIAINSGLLATLQNEAELAAVLAHEVAHAAAGHGIQRYQRGLLSEGLVTIAGIGLGAAGVGGGNELMGIGRQAAQVIGLGYSRNAERQADFYGSEFMAKAGYDPYAAVTLQEKFLALSGGAATTGPAVWFASHPPSAERVDNNRMRTRQLREAGYQGGRFGQAEYAAATRLLNSREAAYEYYDEAVVLIKEGELDAALSRVNLALQAFDGEPRFHGLRGIIRYRQERYDDALTNVNRAIERDPNYFQDYLVRGGIWVERGQNDRAKVDLRRSMQLLPTQDAQRMFVALDIGENPARYVDVNLARTEQGPVVSVSNRAGIDLRNVLIQVEVGDSQGVRNRSVSLDRLAAGDRVQRQVGIDIPANAQGRAYTVSAEVVR